MFLSLLAGIGLLFLGLWLARWFVAADPRTLTFATKAVGVAALLVVGAVLVLSGREGWLLGLAPFLLPLLLRRGTWAFSSGLGILGSGGGSRAAGDSHVRTRFLDMRLDHGSGELDGVVLEGEHEGRMLSALSQVELMDLHRLLTTSDHKSARLLEAYLDRRFSDWRSEATGASSDGASSDGVNSDGGRGREYETAQAAPTSAAMTREEAFRVLGLPPDADEDAIRDAYHRLISGVHPDRGGSSFLAAQVNRARDVLLGGKRAG